VSELLVEQDGAVLTVTFNRPDQRNAMTFAMYEGLEEACARADSDDSVRVLVLRGAGGRASSPAPTSPSSSSSALEQTAARTDWPTRSASPAW
jgi:1,4-dihydroxy-2-naphthoyl-CoA synthase